MIMPFGGEGEAMIPIQVLHSSCQESLPLPLVLRLISLLFFALVVEISAGPLVLEKEGRAMIPIMHRLLPLDDDDVHLLL